MSEAPPNSPEKEPTYMFSILKELRQLQSEYPEVQGLFKVEEVCVDQVLCALRMGFSGIDLNNDEELKGQVRLVALLRGVAVPSNLDPILQFLRRWVPDALDP